MRITILGALVLPLLMSGAPDKARVQVTPNEARRRVDVTIDGKPFTSYIWPTTLKKPTLYPLRTAKGTIVTRGLEQPADKAEILTDASGQPINTPVLDNTGVTGEYVSSEGLKGDAVWGTRGRWTLLGGTVDNEPVTLAILDNPSNPGFPTYWHARGYGLFAANPLGESVFTNGKKSLDLTLEPGKAGTFR